MSAPIEKKVNTDASYKMEPVQRRCYCWPCCPKIKTIRHYHERELTQYEIDYSKIVVAERVAKKAFEEKK